VFFKKSIQLTPQILQVYKNGQPGLGEVVLKDAICAVQRALKVEIDDEISAADGAGSAGTGLDKPPFLDRQIENLLPFPDRIRRIAKDLKNRLLSARAAYDLTRDAG
jgi:hypothetical protein